VGAYFLRSMMMALKWTPPLLLVALPLLIFSGIAFPDTMERAVSGTFASQMPILIGYSATSSNGVFQDCSAGSSCGSVTSYHRSDQSRSFVLLRPADGSLKTVTIESRNGQTPTVTLQNVTPLELLALGLYACLLAGSIWWFWLRNLDLFRSAVGLTP
jgi:hypothetical protein